MTFPKTVVLTCGSMLAGLALGGPALGDETRAEALAAKQGSDAVRTQSSVVSDAWREGKLETVYLLNRHLNNFAIDTEVRGRRAILTGNVESQVDRHLAEELALGIDGINEVDNRLVVGPNGHGREGSRSFAAATDEATLAAEVKIELLANGEISGLAIDVDVSGATVTLTGQVSSDAERALAAQIAENVEGVKAVENNLEVVSS
ncbi:MAG: BON domain-containing protein [Halioglobus sp.]|nr:BON domain-containing protein [Halioglobus sp.]